MASRDGAWRDPRAASRISGGRACRGCAAFLATAGAGWSHSDVRAAVQATKRKTLADNMARVEYFMNSMLWSLKLAKMGEKFRRAM